MAHYYAQLIIDQQLLDISTSESKEKEKRQVAATDYQLVDIHSISHERVREIGAEWLCQQALEQLGGLEPALKSLGWVRKWIARALIYLIARCVYPASDRQTDHWLLQNSGLGELYHLPPGKVNRYHLYEVSKRLYKYKAELESYLRQRTRELFSLEDQIWIYDLTNTYFEGEKRDTEKAHYRRSKEKRSDAKLLSLALVVDRYGFVKYSKIYEGNIKESKTLQKTLEDLRGKENNKVNKQVIVMDAGIATEENLALLRREGYDYVCVPLSKPRKELPEGEGEEVELSDNKGHHLRVRWVEVEGKEDSFLYVQSEMKEEKEKSIEELLSKRYEAGLQAIKEGIAKKGGVKRVEKVYERLGRLKEKYPSVHRLYEVKLKSDKGIVQEISWQKIKEGSKKPGTYFIRTTLPEQEEKTVWEIYNTIREVEASFRTLKTDLRVRPIYHQKDKASEAHIYGAVLAYILVNSVRHQMKARGIHYDWSTIVRIMNSQKMVNSSLPTKSGKTIYLKKCSEPEEEVRKIYQALNYRDRPFWQKKSVLPENGSP